MLGYIFILALVIIGLLIAILVLLPSTPVVYARIVNTYTTGVTPAGIAITPDGKFAYVCNDNSYGITGMDSVTVLNLVTGIPETIIYDASFHQPYTVTINAAGTLAYVTNSAVGTVSIITIASNTVSGVISGFNGPSGFVIVGNTAYVNEYGAGLVLQSGLASTVKVVNLSTNTVTSTITVGLAPAAMAATPDNKYLYVANYVTGLTSSGTVSVVDTATNLVTKTISGFSGPFDIVITPNGKYAYVSNFGSNNFTPFGTTVSVIDLTTNTITATISVGIQPAGLAVSADGLYVFVSNYNTLYSDPVSFAGLTPGDGTVSVIKVATNTLVSPTLQVGLSPSALAVSPTTGLVYVSNFVSNSVNAINFQL